MISSKWRTISIALCASFSVTGITLAEQAEHISQKTLSQMIDKGQISEAFLEAFEVCDELFEHKFTSAEGGGANVGEGQRFSLVPRADLNEEGEWATHFPNRATGPNGQSCTECHSLPVGDGAGSAAMNNIRDPLHTGDISKFINRQTPYVFGIGALQMLAEEMTTELQQHREIALKAAMDKDIPMRLALFAKGIEFGALTAYPDQSLDTSEVEGVDADLVVKPFDWKGSVASVRDFVLDAGHQEIGMQAVEIVGSNVDGDGDGVVNELSAGDVTAITIYQAGQPRPVTKTELANLGLLDPLSSEELALITEGSKLFVDVGCTTCHTSKLAIENTVYSEPSLHKDFRPKSELAIQELELAGLTTSGTITFDITKDMPDNIIEMKDGSRVHLGNFLKDINGRAVVELFSDLRRHNMGPELAETIDAAGTGADSFITKELWGVGSTAPYLHDGRATTLLEAIGFHGGEAKKSRAKFRALTSKQQAAIIAYMNNLVLFKAEE